MKVRHRGVINVWRVELAADSWATFTPGDRAVIVEFGVLTQARSNTSGSCIMDKAAIDVFTEALNNAFAATKINGEEHR